MGRPILVRRAARARLSEHRRCPTAVEVRPEARRVMKDNGSFLLSFAASVPAKLSGYFRLGMPLGCPAGRALCGLLYTRLLRLSWLGCRARRFGALPADSSALPSVFGCGPCASQRHLAIAGCGATPSGRTKLSAFAGEPDFDIAIRGFRQEDVRRSFVDLSQRTGRVLVAIVSDIISIKKSSKSGSWSWSKR